MGSIVDILRERFIGPGVYNNTALLEINECIHFHYRDLRLVMSKNDFLALCGIFAKAEKKFREIGSPESTEQMVSLADTTISQGISHNRMGIEVQVRDDVHVHYRDLRIHVNIADLFAMCEVFGTAALNIPERYVAEVNISDCFHHPVVNDYVKFLKEYASGEPKKTEGMKTLRNRMITTWSKVGDYFQRVLGFPAGYPRMHEKSDDDNYLIAMYESIKKHGYAPDDVDVGYMVAHKQSNGRIYLTGSHRLASLIALGYTKMKVVLVSPETNWKEV
jgi:hypothetical protein